MISVLDRVVLLIYAGVVIAFGFFVCFYQMPDWFPEIARRYQIIKPYKVFLSFMNCFKVM